MQGRIALRPVDGRDLPALYEQQLDPVAVRMAVFPSRPWEAFEGHWKKILADPTVVARALVENGSVAGYLVVWGPPDDRLVGYWLGREFWGKGLATAGLALFLEDLAERPIHAHVAKSNAGSIRVLEKCGFKVTGEDRAPVLPGVEHVEDWIMRLDR